MWQATDSTNAKANAKAKAKVLADRYQRIAREAPNGV